MTIKAMNDPGAEPIVVEDQRAITGTAGGPPVPRAITIAGDQRLSLCGGQSLLVQRAPARTSDPHTPLAPDASLGAHSTPFETLTLMDAAGVARLTIRVTPEATTIELGGGPQASVKLSMEGDLAIDARRVSLHAREHMAITSGQDIVTHAEDSITQSARRQSLTATLGDLALSANDDVRVEGERIRMNC